MPMMFSDLQKNAMGWRATQFSMEQETDGPPVGGSPPNDTRSPLSILQTLLISCGGFLDTATFFLRPSDCTSCVRKPGPSRNMKRSPSKKLSQHSLRSSPSREGEVVDVPIKLVKSRSRSNKDDGEGDDSYRSFDDSISALSAHTLDEMAMRYPKPIYTTLRGPEGSSRPRNGDQLLPPPPAERISDSEASNESEDLPDDCRPTKDVENDIPAVKKLEPLRISKVDTAPTYKLIENDTFLEDGLPRKSYRARQQAATSKSSGRKSRRHFKRTLELEPQMAEI